MPDMAYPRRAHEWRPARVTRFRDMSCLQGDVLHMWVEQRPKYQSVLRIGHTSIGHTHRAAYPSNIHRPHLAIVPAGPGIVYYLYGIFLGGCYGT